MFPKQALKKQQAFSLFAALFIIIILGLLGTTMLRLTQYGNLTVAQEVLNVRAFFAAESGAHGVAMGVFPTTGAGACNNQVFNFSQAGLTGCRATVTCSTVTVNGENYYRVSSTGQCAVGSEVETSRTLQVMLKDI